MENNGIEDSPDGEAMRQVPSVFIPWSQTVWVSETGTVRNRYFDVVSETWKWGKIRLSVTGRCDRLGHSVYGRFRTVEQIIALAWVPRKTPMKRMVQICHRKCEGLVAHNLYWSDEPSYDDEDDDIVMEGQASDDHIDRNMCDGEEWLSVAFKIGLVQCRSGLLISRDGRLYDTRTSHVESGCYGLGPCRFYPIAHVGLVPLQRLSELLFISKRTFDSVPRRIKTVMRLLRTENTIDEIATKMGVKAGTAWSYTYLAMRAMSTESATEHTRRLVSCNVLTILMTKLASETPFVLTGRLRDVTNLVTKVMPPDPSWCCNSQRFNEVSAIRTLLQRTHRNATSGYDCEG